MNNDLNPLNSRQFSIFFIFFFFSSQAFFVFRREKIFENRKAEVPTIVNPNFFNRGLIIGKWFVTANDAFYKKKNINHN